jgi:hypothetical protein
VRKTGVYKNDRKNASLVFNAVSRDNRRQDNPNAKTESACHRNSDRLGSMKLKGAKKPATSGMYMYAPVVAFGRCGKSA